MAEPQAVPNARIRPPRRDSCLGVALTANQSVVILTLIVAPQPSLGDSPRHNGTAEVSNIKGLIVIEPNLDRVWAALTTGARPGRSPFTVLQLATLGLDGAPKVRSVIPRSADAEQDAVSLLTHLRSAEIEEIRHQPRVSVLGYDADAGFQIRLEGKTTIDTRVRTRLRLGTLVDLIPARCSSITSWRNVGCWRPPTVRERTGRAAKGRTGPVRKTVGERPLLAQCGRPFRRFLNAGQLGRSSAWRWR